MKVMLIAGIVPLMKNNLIGYVKNAIKISNMNLIGH